MLTLLANIATQASRERGKAGEAEREDAEELEEETGEQHVKEKEVEEQQLEEANKREKTKNMMKPFAAQDQTNAPMNWMHLPEILDRMMSNMIVMQ
jgi:hypothetical protein